VGIPGDVDLAMLTFGPSGPVSHLRPFTEALAATMHQTRALFGDDALLQIEVPVESVVLARARRPGCGQRWPACWLAGRSLRYLHAPLAAADDPPPASHAFYRPLAGLKLGHGVRFVAGFAHEDQDAAVQFRIREMIEGAVGHPVDVSTQPRPARARRRPGRDGPHQAPARRLAGRMSGADGMNDTGGMTMTETSLVWA
jgi:hypothetical protein